MCVFNSPGAIGRLCVCVGGGGGGGGGVCFGEVFFVNGEAC